MITYSPDMETCQWPGVGVSVPRAPIQTSHSAELMEPLPTDGMVTTEPLLTDGMVSTERQLETLQLQMETVVRQLEAIQTRLDNLATKLDLGTRLKKLEKTVQKLDDSFQSQRRAAYLRDCF